MRNIKVTNPELIKESVKQLGKKLRNIFLATMPAKKDDPDYVAIRGHVPKNLYKRFKVFCLEREVDNSQGLEDLLSEYFEIKDKEQPSSTSKGAA